MKNKFIKFMAFLSFFMVGATPTIDPVETRFRHQISTSKVVYVVLVDPWQKESLKLERLAKIAFIWDNIIWVDVTKPWAKKRWGAGNPMIKSPPATLKYENGRMTEIRRGLNKSFVYLIANLKTTK